MLIGIYKITSPSNKIYIGQSLDIERRFKAYKNINKVKRQPAIYNSLLKYGTDNHLFEIIEECEIEELNERERYWQEKYQVLGPNGLNCSYVKSNSRVGKLSDETKEKIGAKHRGKIVSNETKEKLSNSRKGLVSIKGETHPTSKKIIDMETKEIFNSIKEASEKYGIKYGTLKDWLRYPHLNKTNLAILDGWGVTITLSIPNEISVC